MNAWRFKSLKLLLLTTGLLFSNFKINSIANRPQLIFTPNKEGETPFIHPCGWITSTEIARIRTKVLAIPEGDFFSNAKNTFLQNEPNEHYRASPVPVVIRITGGQSPDGSDIKLRMDATNAYNLMLKWVITGEQKYGDAAIRVIDDWSAVLQSIKGEDARLAAGIYGNKFAQAAELAAYCKKKWILKGRAQRMFMHVFYPVIKKGASSNWGTSCMAGIISIGVFCDDHALFNEAIGAYKSGWPIQGTDGCAGVTQYIDETGQCAESGRDQPHTQGGIAHLLETAVTAWNNHVNLFTYADNRLLKGFEYTAKYNLGLEVPWHPFVDACNLNSKWPSISSKGRGRFSPVYEMAFTYFTEAGLKCPYVKQITDLPSYSPEIGNHDHPGYGTLVFRR